ncbi:alpha/beta hydrolase [Actinomadura barringtoniae]|uniref:Alpha/beta hydrolase n=1 Tax=Actinomadura barringtoniae TaxID=1427535 RepID=A0A939PQ67_9ACTN|nr:alpha/beta hydrolase [Actinomadura barringtoniae]MBO2453169.1 alpha/beta hydrolase [Actinomadura barringtoniae]
MTVVYVHGVPDTATVWDPLRSLLADHDDLAVRLPGFGTDSPAAFTATRFAYMNWLIGELDAIGEPVDLVGHDQGSVIAQGVIVTRPDLVRSWVLGGGVCADDYLWHPQARVWQTAELGEASRDQLLALDPAARVQVLEAVGVPPGRADEVATGIDRRMLDHILPLYRSEPFFGDWAFTAGTAYPPGLVLWGRDDPFQSASFGRSAADIAAADYLELDCGHWWQIERPEEVAAALTGHWNRAAATSADARTTS